MQIRKIQSEDLISHRKDILRLLDQCIDASFQELGPTNFSERKISDMQSYLKDGSAQIFVAEECDRFVGLLWGYRVSAILGPRFHIAYIAVDPEYRGKGIGTMLLDSAELKARQMGVLALELIVTQDNSTALQFYNSLQYRVERLYLKKDLN